LPRELELPADGVLRIRPLRELAKLRYDGKSRESLVVKDGTTLAIDEASGDAVELEVTIAAPLPTGGRSHVAGRRAGRRWDEHCRRRRPQDAGLGRQRGALRTEPPART
jgi:hypothetical protein